jgi:hypothetical protein
MEELSFYGTDEQAESIMRLINGIQDSCILMTDLLEHSQLLDSLQADPMAIARHNREFDVEAALVGSSWMADSCLLEFHELIVHCTEWVHFLAHEVVAHEQEGNKRVLEVLVGTTIVCASLAKEVIERYGDCIEDDIMALAREAAAAFDEKIQRKTVLQMIKEDAYSDPSVAALAELTKGGLKTRNKFYKRS